MYIKFSGYYYKGKEKLPPKITKFDEGIKFSIRVIPKSSKNALISAQQDDVIKLKITAPPIEGKANEAGVKYLAEILNVANSKVKIISGQKSRNKTVEVFGDPEVLYNKLLKVVSVQ